MASRISLDALEKVVQVTRGAVATQARAIHVRQTRADLAAVRVQMTEDVPVIMVMPTIGVSQMLDALPIMVEQVATVAHVDPVHLLEEAVEVEIQYRIPAHAKVRAL